MELHYGNINKENLKYLKEKNAFTKHFNLFNNIDYPNFLDSCSEIKQISEIQRNAENSANRESIFKFCEQWDSSLLESMQYWLKRLGIPHNEEYINFLADASEDLGALIMQLKNHYNRARPFQYAYQSNQNFNPYETLSGNTPAYPSGHASQSYFICSIVANHYEDKKEELMKLAKRVADSRIVMGVHFPSDNEFGVMIAKQIMSKKEIRAKYF